MISCTSLCHCVGVISCVLGCERSNSCTKTEDLIVPRWTQPGEMVSRRCGEIDWTVPHFCLVHLVVYKECQYELAI